ncbi:deleted in malignant brain tumors 1 protein-like [Acanthaster planci]|uniref:Deleted in malignant brain tumors 1 protein-like n=1 Tax=Acanthaster planci TaxID=133434 RepID=A0A8B7YI83_ACAPL|nr:deleted in malignant brain tumors 1 protein-like [Acanthaster planci]
METASVEWFRLCIFIYLSVFCMQATLSAPPPLSVRLTSGEYDNSGLVQVFYDGEWGLLCMESNQWTRQVASVICRQLGYPSAVTATNFVGTLPESYAVTWVSSLSCMGYETRLSDCSPRTEQRSECGGSVYFPKVKAAVHCQLNPAFSLRLTGGFHDNSGLIEVYDRNKWGILCLSRDQWNQQAGSVVCGQLGFPKALTVTSFHGDYSRAYVTSREMSCEGTESRLIDCSFELSQTYGCDSDHVKAAVICMPKQVLIGDAQQPYSLRLHQFVLDNSTSTGVVQLQAFAYQYVDQDWSICSDESWDIQAATVVCQELGFHYAIETSGTDYMGTGDDWSVLGSVECIGSERHLLECSHVIIDRSQCNGGLVRVNCSISPSPDPGQVVRLVGSVKPYEGQLQTYFNGNWWNICIPRSGLEYTYIQKACGSLGYEHGQNLPTLRFSKEYSKISEDSLNIEVLGLCDNADQCHIEESYYTTCGYYDKAAIRCDNHSSSPNKDWTSDGVNLRLSDGDSMASGRVEIYWNYYDPDISSIWSTLCVQSGLDMVTATLLCRELGYDGAVSTGVMPLRGRAAEETKILQFRGNWCEGDEKRLSACSSFEISPDCTHNDDVSVVCNSAQYEGTSSFPAVGIVGIVLLVCVIIIVMVCCITARRASGTGRSSENPGNSASNQGPYELVSEGTEQKASEAGGAAEVEMSATAPPINQYEEATKTEQVQDSQLV